MADPELERAWTLPGAARAAGLSLPAAAVTVLVLVLGEPGSPVDRLLPEPVALRIRMLSLQKGMSEAQVDRRLGLKAHLLGCMFQTGASRYCSYSIGQSHRLTVLFSLRDGGPSYGLDEVTLTADGRRQ